jgi:hypothetical protein
VVEALKIVTREKNVIQNKVKKRRQRRTRNGFSENDSFSFQEQTHLLNIANCVDAIKKSFRGLGTIEAKRFAISERNRQHVELSGMNTMLK